MPLLADFSHGGNVSVSSFSACMCDVISSAIRTHCIHICDFVFAVLHSFFFFVIPCCYCQVSCQRIQESYPGDQQERQANTASIFPEWGAYLHVCIGHTLNGGQVDDDQRKWPLIAYYVFNGTWALSRRDESFRYDVAQCSDAYSGLTGCTELGRKHSRQNKSIRKAFALVSWGLNK